MRQSGDLPRRRGLTARVSLGASVSKTACKPSSVPRSRPRGRSSIYGRRSPVASSGRPEDGATHPFQDVPADTMEALLFGLAPGRACPFHPARSTKVDLSVRHCGARPRLSADGSYPLPCVAELGLSSCRSGSPRRDTRPSGRLTDVIDSTRRDHDGDSGTARPSARRRPSRPSRSPGPPRASRCARSGRAGARPRSAGPVRRPGGSGWGTST